jgi:RNA-binding protein 26
VNNAGDARVLKETLVSNSPASPGLKKTSSGEAAQVGVQQVSLKPTRSPRPRTASGVSAGHPTAAWGPARFKLDNRTTTFRVQPPLPATISDVSFIFPFDC